MYLSLITTVRQNVYPVWIVEGEVRQQTWQCRIDIIYLHYLGLHTGSLRACVDLQIVVHSR